MLLCGDTISTTRNRINLTSKGTFAQILEADTCNIKIRDKLNSAKRRTLSKEPDYGSAKACSDQSKRCQFNLFGSTSINRDMIHTLIHTKLTRNHYTYLTNPSTTTQ